MEYHVVENPERDFGYVLLYRKCIHAKLQMYMYTCKVDQAKGN